LTKLITDEMVEDALEYLAKSSELIAAARAMRLRSEFERKQIRSRLFLSAEGTVAFKDAYSESHPDYVAACNKEIEAAERDELYRSERSTAETIIEAWRTESSNLRAGNSFK